MKTKKVGERVDFLYELIEQGANQSFGIYVAKLAGLPKSVLVEATNILHKLETEKKPPKLQAINLASLILTENLKPLKDLQLRKEK